MKKTRVISRKRVHGEVEFNDGEFAEIQTFGSEGIEMNLLLVTIQKHLLIEVRGADEQTTRHLRHYS